jgi:hypothetical protein
MKGDFSRQTFDPRRHYDGVLMQQGRVQLDADWNEQDAINRYRDEIEALDTIGRCGGPLHAAGFEITTNGKQLFIGQGRYWVDGILVENDLGDLGYDQASGDKAALAFDDQPYFAGGTLGDLLKGMQENGSAAALVYLDVWQRHVTALEDVRLREVALGGPDTTTRIQTVWQVKLLPLERGDDPRRNALLERRKGFQADMDATGQASDQLAAQVKDLQAKLDAAPAGSAAVKRLQTQIAKLETQQKELDGKKEEISTALTKIDRELAALGGGQQPSCEGEIPGWDELFRQPGMLNARARPGDPADDPCQLPPGGGYTRLENQLYRVEIHRGGNLGAATFKWSRDNGTVVAAIEQISGSTVRVDSLGPDDVLGFASGQWVEILDDSVELSGVGGQLAKITNINTGTRELSLDPAPKPLDDGADGIDRTLHPRLRRWDQSGKAATADGVATGTDWIALEDGVEVQFTQPDGTDFAPGDYWVIPARTATADLDWPPCETPNANPTAQPPPGIRHHFCRLALISWDGKQLGVSDDCRQLFPPLTEINCAREALHVTAINWQNDGPAALSLIADPGLRITLDAAPDPASVSNDSVLVTYDYPFTLANTTPPNIKQRLVALGSSVGLDPNDPKTIVWRYQETSATTGTAGGAQPAPAGGTQPPATGAPAPTTGGTQPSTGGAQPSTGGTTQPPAGGVVATPGGGIFHPPLFGGVINTNPLVTRDVATLSVVVQLQIRLNVTLRGSFIWRNEQQKRMYLDGQALGVPAMDPGSNQARTDLDLPSGDGRRASDFESWMFLGTPRPQAQSLQVVAVTFRSTIGAAPHDVLTVKQFTTDPAKFQPLQGSDSVNAISIQFNRAVKPEGTFTSDAPAPVLVEMLGPNGKRCIGDLTVKGDRADFIARSPEVYKQPGDYRLTVFADAASGVVTVTAQDDGSALDGNMDGQPGTNFFLMFRVS